MSDNQPTPEQQAGWDEWVASRPPNVRAVAEKFQPWNVYRLGTTGHRVFITSFDEQEDGSVTMKVAVTADLNPGLLFERGVFGIKPEDLEPCDLPAERGGEPLLDQEEAGEYIAHLSAKTQHERN